MMRRIGFLPRRLLQRRMLRLCASAAVIAAFVVARQTEWRVSAQSASPPVTVTTTQLGISPGAPTAAESDESVPVSPEGTAAVPPSGAAALSRPRTPLAESSENLLKLANSLKADMDKTTKDMLSVSVIREAGQIEQLAHRMRTQ